MLYTVCAVAADEAATELAVGAGTATQRSVFIFYLLTRSRDIDFSVQQEGLALTCEGGQLLGCACVRSSIIGGKTEDARVFY